MVAQRGGEASSPGSPLLPFICCLSRVALLPLAMKTTQSPRNSLHPNVSGVNHNPNTSPHRIRASLCHSAPIPMVASNHEFKKGVASLYKIKYKRSRSPLCYSLSCILTRFLPGAERCGCELPSWEPPRPGSHVRHPHARGREWPLTHSWSVTFYCQTLL